jgi:hypothetical protein
VCPVLPVSLACPFMMATSVISNVYLSCVLCARCCQCLWFVHSTGQINVRDNWSGHHEWTRQRHWQHRTHKTQDKKTLEITEGAIMNGQATDTGNTGHTRSLACPFLMATSVISNVYLSCVLCIRCCQCLWLVHSWWPLQLSLTCICPVSCVWGTGNTGNTRHRTNKC